MVSRTGLWLNTKHLVALEYGNRFDEWTAHDGTGSWNQVALEDVERGVVSWKNAGGSSVGSAMYHVTHANLALSATSPNQDEHTVHIRVSRSSTETVGFAIGPATALTASSATGYFVLATAANVIIGKLSSGTPSTLSTVAKTVTRGDVLSLAYRYDTVDSEADLSALVNGDQVDSHTDSSSPHHMNALSGRVGLYGTTAPSLANALGIGHVVNEWWVTDQFKTIDRPEPYYPGGIR